MVGQISSSFQRRNHLEWNKADFATLLTSYRQQRGLSGGQLARASQFSRVYLFQMERGQRRNPSPQIVRRLAHALGLDTQERDHFYRAYTSLTGNSIETFQDDEMLLDPNVLVETFVQRSPYPAHTLDQLWFLSTSNEAAEQLFDLGIATAQAGRRHVLEVLFSPSSRQHVRDFEWVARCLIHDFCLHTQHLVHLPAYQTLWKRLQMLPGFTRLAATSSSEQGVAVPLRFSLQHPFLGTLTLRAVVTRALLANSQRIISYLPDDQRTLECYRQQAWYQQTPCFSEGGIEDSE